MDVVVNPPIPYCHVLPEQLVPGSLIHIEGTASPVAKCFSINLQNGSSKSEIALHLSPVFSHPSRVVRNSIQNHQWGPEESHGSFFPFSAGQAFEILIVAGSDQFKIAVNGQHFCEYEFRLPLSTATWLSIDGDVTISRIKFESTTSGVSHTPQDSGISRPIGFINPDITVQSSSPGYGMPSAPSYGSQSLPYPTGAFGPPATGGNYGLPSPNSPSYPAPPSYGPPSPGHSPSANYPYGPPTSGPYPTAEGYPGSYPSQPGPQRGTTVVYPGQEKSKSTGSLSSLATGTAAALAGAAGLMKAGKSKKHGFLGAGGPATILSGGLGSMLSSGHSKPGKHSSPIPIGGVVAGGAAALAGAYVLSKSPLGKIMKPKKMKKLYKHKHKMHGFGGFGSSSSSSSSEEE